MHEPPDNPKPASSKPDPSSPVSQLTDALGPLLQLPGASGLASLWNAAGFVPSVNPFPNPAADVAPHELPDASPAAQPESIDFDAFPAEAGQADDNRPPDVASLLQSAIGHPAGWVGRLPRSILERAGVQRGGDRVLILGGPPTLAGPAAGSTEGSPAQTPAIHVAMAVEASPVAAPGPLDTATAVHSLVASGAVPTLAIVQPANSSSTASLHGYLRNLGIPRAVDVSPPTDASSQGANPRAKSRILLLGRREAGTAALPEDFQADDDALVLVGPVASQPESDRPVSSDTDAAVLRDGLLALVHGNTLHSARVLGSTGLAATVARSGGLIGGPAGTPKGAALDFSLLFPSVEKETPPTARIEDLLFGTLPNHVLCTTAPLDAGKLVAQAKILGLSAAVIGKVGGGSLSAKSGTWTWPVREPQPSMDSNPATAS